MISGWPNRDSSHRAPQGDLRDLILHRYEAGEVIAVSPDDTLGMAFKRMPRRGRFAAARRGRGRCMSWASSTSPTFWSMSTPTQITSRTSVSARPMTDRLETLRPTAGIDALLGVFDRGRVAIVMDGDRFLGLITRSDLLSYLRLQFS